MPISPKNSSFSWGDHGLKLNFHITDQGRLGLRSIGEINLEESHSTLLDSPASLVEIRTVRDGSSAGHQNLHSTIGDRLLYVSHTEEGDGSRFTLTLKLQDPTSALEVEILISSRFGSSSFTASTTVINGSDRPTTLLSVSALMVELVEQSKGNFTDYRLWWANNAWTKECRWCSATLNELLVPDLIVTEHSLDSRRPFGISGLGTWPSGRYLPMGILENERTGFALAWQVENPGPWRWEVGDRLRSLVVGAFGPLDNEHQWSQTLMPGECFSTPKVTFAFGDAFWSSAISELSRARRSNRLPHSSFVDKPVVYNDFFALFAEPTESKLIPLIDAAAAAGIEVFCIDAGWFDFEHNGIGGGAAGGQGWWDALGQYEESPWRFPNGMLSVIDRIRDAGMVPGIWLEPEVIGVRSPIVDDLPPEAFFLRYGEKVVEHGRYHLDFSHPAARAHVDALIDRVVGGYGFGYIKLDYNINPGLGSTAATSSAGEGLMAHGRAMLDWLAGVSERYPNLIIMNCASGGMRMDGATQRHTHVQQMSDQASPVPFAYISVAAPTAVPSDQAAAWLNPDPSMSREEVEFAAVAPLLCRFEVSGPISTLPESHKKIVAEAIELYKSVRIDVGISDPYWPWGLPKFDDTWLTLAQRNDNRTLLGVWRCGGLEHERSLVLPWLIGSHAKAQVLFPSEFGGEIKWEPLTGTLTVRLPREPMAVLIEVR